jgi:hypothetical protein
MSGPVGAGRNGMTFSHELPGWPTSFDPVHPLAQLLALGHRLFLQVGHSAMRTLDGSPIMSIGQHVRHQQFFGPPVMIISRSPARSRLGDLEQ